MEFSHKALRFTVPDSVYPPAEDSFMLAEAAELLRGNILEIGCGSGIASIICAATDENNRVTGIDINPEAVRCATENASRNNASNAHFLQGDLFSPIGEKRFNAILFNPPYLPTEENEKLKGDLNKAFDGGKDGRETVDRFLYELDMHLLPGGTLFLVQSSLNDLEKTRRALTSIGYNSSIEKERSFFFEKIYLLKAVKPQL